MATFFFEKNIIFADYRLFWGKNRPKKPFFHIAPKVLNRQSANLTHNIRVGPGSVFGNFFFRKKILFLSIIDFLRKETDRKAVFFQISSKVLNRLSANLTHNIRVGPGSVFGNFFFEKKLLFSSIIDFLRKKDQKNVFTHCSKST